MRGPQKNIFIIVPCYNEERRLRESLKEFLDSPYSFIFVDDGSIDGTRRILEDSVKAPNYFISLEKNSGKAEAVRRGVQFLKTTDGYKDAEWIGFWDCDLATPIGEVEGFLDCARSPGDADAVYGSRVMRLGSVIKRSAFRHFLGRVFCTLISLLFGLRSYDTQCGAKLFRKKLIDAAFSERFISGWIFDVEIVLRLRDFKQVEHPLSRWEDVKGSKITPLKALIPVVLDIFNIWKKYRR